jgi:thioesterase domain-containing protein
LPLNANGKINLAALNDSSLVGEMKFSTASEPPVGSVEETIAVIWKDLLGITNIGRDDDFFALGGHSLMALRMFSRLNRELEWTFPLAALINNPTIRELAALVVPTHQPDADSTDSSPSKGHYVTIRDEGDQTPLFCIHGGDGGVMFYRDLATHLPSGYPLHAIESQELYRSTAISPTSVEETADHYVRCLLKAKHQGPFRLVGYSFGGFVAYAMACQLVRMRYEVSFLGLLDTHSPNAEHTPYSSIGRLAKFWKQHEEFPIPARISLLQERVRVGIETHSRVRSEILAAKASGPATAYSDLRRIQVREENWRSMQLYRPPVFPGTITLFKAVSGSDKFEWPEDYGWAQSAGSDLRILTVPGTHLTMFEPENVGALANSLHRSLCGEDSLI